MRSKRKTDSVSINFIYGFKNNTKRGRMRTKTQNQNTCRRKTRKDHTCEFCGKIIPKGTPTAEIVIISAGGRAPHRHTLGSHHGAFSYWGFRKYYHKDCYIASQIVKEPKPFALDFYVQRGITEVIYTIAGCHEITIPLVSGNQHTRENWNKAVKKADEIYEFARRHGLSMYPEISLKNLQVV